MVQSCLSVMEFHLVIRHFGGLNGHRPAMALCVLSQGRPKITWYEVSPSITCIKVCALIGPTLKSKDTCPKVHCCNDPIPATLSGSRMILSHGMLKASNVGRGKILVEALVSTKALLIYKASKNAVTYKGEILAFCP